MFALLFFPGVQEKLQIILDDPLDVTQVALSKFALRETLTGQARTWLRFRLW